MRKRQLVNIILLVSSVLFCVVVSESFIRISLYRKNLKYDHKRLSGIPAKEEVADLGDILQIPSRPGESYVLRPMLDVYFLGVKVKTNSQGFRDREYPKKKPERTFRILGLGDSLMFGWGIHQDKNYLSLLEKKLDQRCPAQNWEVINTAVPGYNTGREIKLLERSGVNLHPDIVILGFVESNDLEIKPFFTYQENVFSLKKLFLYEYIEEKFDKISSNLDKSKNRLIAGRYDKKAWNSFQQALYKLKSLAHRYHFSVVIYIHEYTHPEIIKTFSKMGFGLIDGYAKVAEYMKGNHITRYQSSELVLSEQDLHPSEIGHQIAAEEIYSYLEQNLSLLVP